MGGQAEGELKDALAAFVPASDDSEPTGTAREILAAAELVLSGEGLEKFSMRTIASRVGISLASLQYHFPTRAELLRQFFAYKARAYAELLRDQLLALSDDPEAALRFTLRLLLRDALDTPTHALYTQLWALACYDADARAALDKHMHVYLKLFTLLVSRARPGLSREATHARAVALVSMIEGFPVTIPESESSGPRVEALREAVVDLALHLATA